MMRLQRHMGAVARIGGACPSDAVVLAVPPAPLLAVEDAAVPEVVPPPVDDVVVAVACGAAAFCDSERGTHNMRMIKLRMRKETLKHIQIYKRQQICKRQRQNIYYNNQTTGISFKQL